MDEAVAILETPSSVQEGREAFLAYLDEGPPDEHLERDLRTNDFNDGLVAIPKISYIEALDKLNTHCFDDLRPPTDVALQNVMTFSISYKHMNHDPKSNVFSEPQIAQLKDFFSRFYSVFSKPLALLWLDRVYLERSGRGSGETWAEHGLIPYSRFNTVLLGDSDRLSGWMALEKAVTLAHRAVIQTKGSAFDQHSDLLYPSQEPAERSLSKSLRTKRVLELTAQIRKNKLKFHRPSDRTNVLRIIDFYVGNSKDQLAEEPYIDRTWRLLKGRRPWSREKDLPPSSLLRGEDLNWLVLREGMDYRYAVLQLNNTVVVVDVTSSNYGFKGLRVNRVMHLKDADLRTVLRTLLVRTNTKNHRMFEPYFTPDVNMDLYFNVVAARMHSVTYDSRLASQMIWNLASKDPYCSDYKRLLREGQIPDKFASSLNTVLTGLISSAHMSIEVACDIVVGTLRRYVRICEILGGGCDTWLRRNPLTGDLYIEVLVVGKWTAFVYAGRISRATGLPVMWKMEEIPDECQLDLLLKDGVVGKFVNGWKRHGNVCIETCSSDLSAEEVCRGRRDETVKSVLDVQRNSCDIWDAMSICLALEIGARQIEMVEDSNVEERAFVPDVVDILRGTATDYNRGDWGKVAGAFEGYRRLHYLTEIGVAVKGEITKGMDKNFEYEEEQSNSKVMKYAEMDENSGFVRIVAFALLSIFCMPVFFWWFYVSRGISRVLSMVMLGTVLVLMVLVSRRRDLRKVVVKMCRLKVDLKSLDSGSRVSKKQMINLLRSDISLGVIRSFFSGNDHGVDGYLGEGFGTEGSLEAPSMTAFDLYRGGGNWVLLDSYHVGIVLKGTVLCVVEAYWKGRKREGVFPSVLYVKQVYGRKPIREVSFVQYNPLVRSKDASTTSAIMPNMLHV